MKGIYPKALLAILICSAITNCNAQSKKQNKYSGSIPKTDDEFVGPFKSWLNAKTEFGAKGDGATDDTQALQAAFDEAAKGARNSTLWIPAGTYRVTRTLTMNHHINVSIIGDGPAKTIIKWAGTAHGTIMEINGTAYSRFNRITFNGNKVANIAVEQSWDGKAAHFDTSNEYADDVFEDVGFGIHGGALGHGFAETSILRDRFIRNTSAGVSLGNFNALDIWIRNSLFQDCATGITNVGGAGNYKVYNNIFRNSTESDMAMYNTGGFSVRENTSVNSRQFFYAGGTPNPAITTIQGNTVIDPVNTKAIVVRNQGPTIVINNIIRSRASATTGPVAVFNNGHNADLFSAGNTFTLTNPVDADSNKIEYNDRVVAAANLKYLAEQTLPGTEPCFHRKLFEVPQGANAAAIQMIINKAALVNGKRPIVHIPYGNYLISNTIYIPANTDMQIVGDGYGQQYATTLIWNGVTPGPMISIAGPGKATLRDFTVKGTITTVNILITNTDQKGSRVFLQQFNQSGGQVGMLVNRLDHTLVLAHDSEFGGIKKAIDVIGGPLAEAGNPAEGRTIIYNGAEANNNISHEVTNGGNLMVQDTWYEGGIKSTYANLFGNGIFTANGDKIATPEHTDVPSVVINNFSGRATFMSNDYADRFVISGNGSRAKILALGIFTLDNPFIEDTSSPKADVRALLCRTRDYKSNISGSGSSVIPNIGKYDKKFITGMLENMMNTHSIILSALPDGASDIRLYHVMSLNGAKGLDIETGSITSPETKK